jgi:hypothetical protein
VVAIDYDDLELLEALMAAGACPSPHEPGAPVV